MVAGAADYFGGDCGGVDLFWVGNFAFADDVRECFEAELKQNLVTEIRKKAKIEFKLKD